MRPLTIFEAIMIMISFSSLLLAILNFGQKK
ncbi:putative holin-like toxin [Neobacillus sp. PS3-34]